MPDDMSKREREFRATLSPQLNAKLDDILERRLARQRASFDKRLARELAVIRQGAELVSQKAQEGQGSLYLDWWNEHFLKKNGAPTSVEEKEIILQEQLQQTGRLNKAS